MGTSLLCRVIAVVCVAGMLPGFALAQSSQYKRKSEPAAKPAPGAPAPSGTPGKEGDKKVDVSDLEQRYWAPKDTEFTVVQNRTYTKANRFGLSLGFGSLLNDQYNKAQVTGIALNYYFSERMGVEFNYMSIPSRNGIMTEEFIYKYGLAPDHNKQRSFTGVAFNWIPIYAKISLLEKKIIYFDMSFSPGIGFLTYDHVRKAGTTEDVSFEAGAQALAFSLDIAQHFFISEHFAIRLDLKNHFFQEKIKEARSPFRDLNTQGSSNNIVLFGVTYYH